MVLRAREVFDTWQWMRLARSSREPGGKGIHVFAIASLLAVVAISLLITRAATVILVATGMSRSAARFQARSAFTGAGFTTRESEEVVAHPVRRRVVMSLMLLGNAGIVAAASTLILGFRGGASSPEWARVLVLAGGLLALVLASRNRWIDRRLTTAAGMLLRRLSLIDNDHDLLLAELPHGSTVVELRVRDDDDRAHRPLRDVLADSRAALALDRPSAGVRQHPEPNTVLRPGDRLVVYRTTDDAHP